jgi:hypothetical protein
LEVITYRVEVDGVEVGPAFLEEEEEAHRWVARHHAGKIFTIITIRPEVDQMRVRYPPVVE